VSSKPQTQSSDIRIAQTGVKERIQIGTHLDVIDYSGSLGIRYELPTGDKSMVQRNQLPNLSAIPGHHEGLSTLHGVHHVLGSHPQVSLADLM
jgi:hypothetical protein